MKTPDMFIEFVYNKRKKENKRKRIIKYDKNDLVEFFGEQSEEFFISMIFMVSKTTVEFFYLEEKKVVKTKAVFMEEK